MTTRKRSEVSLNIEKGRGFLSLALPSLFFPSLNDEILSFVEMCNCDSVRVLRFDFQGECNWTPEIDKFIMEKSAEVAQRIEAHKCLTVVTVDGVLRNTAVEFTSLVDLVFATKDSLFEVDGGFVPLYGGIQRFVRTCGLSLSKELFLCGSCDALRLFNAGFINSVFDKVEEMESYFVEMVETVLSKSTMAVSMTKRILESTWDISLEAGLALEREMFGFAFTTEDKREGIEAFFEKRNPKFKRRECHEL